MIYITAKCDSPPHGSARELLQSLKKKISLGIEVIKFFYSNLVKYESFDCDVLYPKT